MPCSAKSMISSLDHHGMLCCFTCSIACLQGSISHTSLSREIYPLVAVQGVHCCALHALHAAPLSSLPAGLAFI